MLTRVQINTAINEKLDAEFPSIPIQSSDVEEGFARPSFFVTLETNSGNGGQFSTQRDMTCRILFFPTNRYDYKEEAYDVQDRLEKLFSLNFAVADRTFTIDDYSSRIFDKVVHYDFDFTFFDDPAVDPCAGENTEKMQELKLRG
ncbi:hypothetical protein BP422_15595 [Brevibacillus formosus]|uniref:Phage protein n=1 Tax=Brevibacillus formosus TaxID=54913 RepID=A0A220MJ35_9BACL|nr:hypothetical protein [Brevibacillus formosus]ASJ54865.1 hypothetical protein BP422_15595 [Brevibacillus formosus]